MRQKHDPTDDAHLLVQSDENGVKPTWNEVGAAVHRVALNKGLTLEALDPTLDVYRHEIEELGFVKVKFLAPSARRRITLTRRGKAAHTKAAGWIKRGKIGTR